MEVRLPTVLPGDEILAEHITALYDLVRRLQVSVAANSGLVMDSGAGGVALGLALAEGFWIRLTSNSGNAFAWTEVIPQSGGTWVDGYRSGTSGSDPARELNGNTSIPALPLIVRAWRAPASHEVLFHLGSC